MSNNKQSSIDWLQAAELDHDLTLEDWQQAKAIHKKEIENAVNQENIRCTQIANNTCKVLEIEPIFRADTTIGIIYYTQNYNK